MDRSRLKVVGATIGAMVVVGVLGVLGFIHSGIYPIAANKEHLPLVSWILTTLQENSVSRAADDIEPPPLDDPELLSIGIRLYERECEVCHGSPGGARDVIGRGLNPNPPRLSTEVEHWTDAELFWIIKHGLKMAGMPSFEPGHTDRELWALTAITRALPRLEPEEYDRMLAAAGSDAPPVGIDSAWTSLVRHRGPMTAGNPEAGKRSIEVYGCGACHVVPGVTLATGTVGPPLTDYGERQYIAGNLLNRPMPLAAFIMAPEAFEPGTAMPDLNVLPDDAWNMAAYLLSLGDGSELGPPAPLPVEWLPLPHDEEAHTIAAPSPPRP